MDFLTLFLIYLCFVLAAVGLLCICSGRKESFLARSVSGASQVWVFLNYLLLGFYLLSEQHTANVFWQNVLWPIAVACFVSTKSSLFVVLHILLQAAVYGEYTWEVFVYCEELQFHLLLLLLPYLLLAGNVGCFILCSRANPGIITKSNHASLVKIYPYDGVLFQKGIVCPTCNMEKPARSKHCRFCSTCVHRFDHHCVWVNNCIGSFNAKYFFFYLFTLTAMAATIAVITTAFLIQVVLLSNMMYGSYIDDQGQEHAVEILFLIQHLFLTFPRIVFMLGFVILLTLVLGAYCCFNLYLALTNQTSNEWHKSRRYGCSHHVTLQPYDRGVVYKNLYSKGIWMNLKEIFKPPTALERKNA